MPIAKQQIIEAIENTENQILRYKLDNQCWLWDGHCDDVEDLETYIGNNNYQVHEDGCEGLTCVEGLVSELSENPYRADQFCVFEMTQEDIVSKEIADYNAELHA